MLAVRRACSWTDRGRGEDVVLADGRGVVEVGADAPASALAMPAALSAADTAAACSGSASLVEVATTSVSMERLAGAAV